MKRQPSPTLPELPASSSRRKRALSEEEHALWESVAKQIKPLRKKSRAARAQAALPDAETDAVKPVAPARPLSPAQMARAAKPEPPSAPPPLAPLGRRERAQLSRGRKQIDARLDLHGMTQTRAHRALFGFLQRAHGEGLTFVLVITGKGKMGVELNAGCCAARCRNGWACRNSARWWSGSRKPISVMAARVRSMCASGGREFERRA